MTVLTKDYLERNGLSPLIKGIHIVLINFPDVYELSNMLFENGGVDTVPHDLEQFPILGVQKRIIEGTSIWSEQLLKEYPIDEVINDIFRADLVVYDNAETDMAKSKTFVMANNWKNRDVLKEILSKERTGISLRFFDPDLEEKEVKEPALPEEE